MNSKTIKLTAMNEQILDIGWWSLLLGYILLIVPYFVMWYFNTGLLKDSIIAVLRMTIQLLLTGVYLEYMFKMNNTLLNIGWAIAMILVAAFTIIRRSGLNYRLYLWPVFLSGLFSILVTDAFFLGGVIRLDNMFEARYFIPITGMLIGNTLRTIIVALNSYYSNIKEKTEFYQWHLANGATRKEALLPFRRHALRNAFNPLIATTAIVGLISLPGMMTGQILGGSSPNTAIKYQIMLMITIFSAATISVVMTMIISDKYAFDKYDNLKI
jgi:putative ABC transport system permease protein